MSGLATVGQGDFGVGVLRGVAPDTQPGVGLYNAVNGLLNDDGDVYRRGGTAYHSSPGGEPLTFLWSGFLANVGKLLVATAAGMRDGLTGAAITGPGLSGPVNPAVLRNTLYLPNGYSWTGGAAMTAWAGPTGLPAGTQHLCAAAGRLLVAAGNRIAFSTAPPDAFAFNALDYHELPGGVVVQGMMALLDTAFVFTNYGLWSISNLAFDLTDALGNVQQQLSLLTPELSLWHESGLCEWEGRIVAPCSDRVYLISGTSAPQPVSDSIAPFYHSFVRAGNRPGGAKVFANHLFLPIIDRASNAVQTVLVCRLNRPTKARYLYFPWSTLTGHAAGMVSGDVSLLTNAPQFLVAHTDGSVSDFTGLLNPTSANPTDADFSAFEFDVETRDFPTGSGQPNHIREIMLRYTLDGDAQITAGYSYGAVAQLYSDLAASGQSYAEAAAAYPDYQALLHGPGWTSGLPTSPDDPERYWNVLTPQRLPAPGLNPARWRLPSAKRVRYARMRFRMTDAVNSLTVHRIDMAVRPAAHSR